MWKFSSFKSGYDIWPPNVGQRELNSCSLEFPNCANTIGIFSSNYNAPFPGFGAQGSPLNNASTSTKGLFVFDQSGDQRKLLFSSVPEAFQTLNPTLPSRNASYNSHGSEKQEEMHEDTKDIDALLYSDSEFSFDSEEATSSPIPPKRRKLDLTHSAVDESIIDTASSARASNFPKSPSDDSADISYVGSGSYLDENCSDEMGKRGRIQTIIKVLRRIIPGGYAMNTAVLLDEAICYLNSLKLQANSMDATTDSV